VLLLNPGSMLDLDNHLLRINGFQHTMVPCGPGRKMAASFLNLIIVRDSEIFNAKGAQG
jgi:hypothetical protein